MASRQNPFWLPTRNPFQRGFDVTDWSWDNQWQSKPFKTVVGGKAIFGPRRTRPSPLSPTAYGADDALSRCGDGGDGSLTDCISPSGAPTLSNAPSGAPTPSPTTAAPTRDVRFGRGGTVSFESLSSKLCQHFVRNHQNSAYILSEFIRNPEICGILNIQVLYGI